MQYFTRNPPEWNTLANTRGLTHLNRILYANRVWGGGGGTHRQHTQLAARKEHQPPKPPTTSIGYPTPGRIPIASMGVHVSATSNRLFFLYHELRAAPTTYSYVMQRDEFEQHADLFLQLRSQPDTTLYPEITFDDGHLSNYEVALPALA